MMLDTEMVARVLEARDRDLVDRLAEWFRTVGPNIQLPTSDSGCRKLAEVILVYPDKE